MPRIKAPGEPFAAAVEGWRDYDFMCCGRHGAAWTATWGGLMPRAGQGAEGPQLSAARGRGTCWRQERW
jgi:hypothetical protein